MLGGDSYSRVGKSIGQYRIVRELGHGGMGVVYEAVHTVIGQRAAIKMISVRGTPDPEFLVRFEAEARAASAVQHPGLVKVFDFGTAPDGAPFLMMEFIEGETLRTHIQERKPFPIARACYIARQMATALSAIHAQGIVHRDLKPENVMLAPDDAAEGGERIKLLDFGIARRVDESSTNPGVIVGTPRYMSPEQCACGKIGIATDVYSLGIVFHEMLYGATPFVGDSARVMRGHIADEVVIVPDQRVSDDLRNLLAAILAKEPAERPTTAAIEDALRRHASEHPKPSGLSTTVFPSNVEAPKARRRPWARSLLGLALLSLATLGAGGIVRALRNPTRPAIGLLGMTELRGGTFTMGRSPEEIAKECERLGPTCRKDALEREQPPRRVTVSPVYLDNHEVTNADFATWLNVDPARLVVEEDSDSHTKRYVFDRAQHRFLLDLWPGHLGVLLGPGDTFALRPGYERKPVVQVTWDSAQMYCEARGKRLPTEAEWELAARDDTARLYPWGDAEPTCKGVVLGRVAGLPCSDLPAGPEDVESSPQDWTPERIADMGGNVSEWVFDAFELPYYPDCGSCLNPRVERRSSEGEDLRVFRGGAWASTIFARASARGRWKRMTVADNIGFRCASDATH